MRKLILLSSVFVLSFAVFAQQDADAQRATEPTLEKVLQKTAELNEKLTILAEQITAGEAAALRGGAAIATAGSYSDTTRTQQGAIAGMAMATSNSKPILCDLTSPSRAHALIDGNAAATIADIGEDQMGLVNQEKGTKAENGLTDSRIKIFEELASKCTPEGNGGADAANCSGSDNEYLTVSSLLNTVAIPPAEIEKRTFFAELALTKATEAILPSSLENPDTNMINIIVEQKQLQALNSVALALYNRVMEGKIAAAGSSVSQYLGDRLRAGGWSDAQIEEISPGGAISKEAYFKVLTYGSDNPAMVLQQLNATEADLMRVIAKELMLNNQLAFENYQKQDAIMLGLAGNIALGLGEPKDKLDAKIRSARRGN